MLKLAIFKCVWVFTILLLVAPVAKTEKYILNAITPTTCSHHNNYCHLRYCESLNTSNNVLRNFTRIIPDFVSVFPNGTCMHDSLSLRNRFDINTTKYTVDDLRNLQKVINIQLNSIQPVAKRQLTSFWIDVIDYYHLNHTFPFHNSPPTSIRVTKSNQKNRIVNKWRRRTLCAIARNEESPVENSLGNNGAVRTKIGGEKTLLDYDGPVFMNDADDFDSLKAHVRVKRSKLEPGTVAQGAYEQDYLRDLANSFPQNNYDSLDDNFYDDDTSLDTKREIKSRDFLLNSKQLKRSTDAKYTGDLIDAPPDTTKLNSLAKSNLKSDGNTGTRHDALAHEFQPLDEIPITNQWSNENLEEQDFPEDPVPAVDFVRRKRDDDIIRTDGWGESKVSIDKSIRSPEGMPEPDKAERNFNPSSLASANLKAELLRIRRKAKENRGEKKAKPKKKKKRVGRKHGARNSQGSVVKEGRAKNTDRTRLARDRKKSDARKEGKSKNVGIAKVVSKKNNANNFRRRSEKAKESFERTESARRRPSKSVGQLMRHAKVKRGTGNKRGGTSARRASTIETDDSRVESDENRKAFLDGNEKEELSKDETSMETPDDAKFRSKMAENSHHGFASKEEELRYYENIREPGSDGDRCRERNENELSVGNAAEGTRAVRSIEEVKELAKKLVTKVNELQNYLNVEEGTGGDQREKKIETRAIDDLCSNVSTACNAFKETPKIVKKCVPSTSYDGSKMNVVDENVDPDGSVADDRKSIDKDGSKELIERKRSIGSRIVKETSNASRRNRKRDESKSNHKWGKWTDWSSCSVTCGKGRQIRWRYCLRDCSTAETEMEEKACQLPACPPGKFLGIF